MLAARGLDGLGPVGLVFDYSCGCDGKSVILTGSVGGMPLGNCAFCAAPNGCTAGEQFSTDYPGPPCGCVPFFDKVSTCSAVPARRELVGKDLARQLGDPADYQCDCSGTRVLYADNGDFTDFYCINCELEQQGTCFPGADYGTSDPGFCVITRA